MLVQKLEETVFMEPLWLQQNLMKILRTKNQQYRLEILLLKNFYWKLA